MDNEKKLVREMIRKLILCITGSIIFVFGYVGLIIIYPFITMLVTLSLIIGICVWGRWVEEEYKKYKNLKRKKNYKDKILKFNVKCKKCNSNNYKIVYTDNDSLVMVCDCGNTEDIFELGVCE